MEPFHSMAITGPIFAQGDGNDNLDFAQGAFVRYTICLVMKPALREGWPRRQVRLESDNPYLEAGSRRSHRN